LNLFQEEERHLFYLILRHDHFGPELQTQDNSGISGSRIPGNAFPVFYERLYNYVIINDLGTIKKPAELQAFEIILY
jgi:hypothetical protein